MRVRQRARLQQVQGYMAVVGLDDLVAHRREREDGHLAEGALVVDHQEQSHALSDCKVHAHRTLTRQGERQDTHGPRKAAPV